MHLCDWMSSLSWFSAALAPWYLANRRDLPWRRTRDPYRIWLSEVILQQTRVDQGLPYYLRFIARFPTVRSLAAAEEDQVLRLWQGLGYYSRARNLHAAAQRVVADHGGRLPDTVAELLKLPGVGHFSESFDELFHLLGATFGGGLGAAQFLETRLGGFQAGGKGAFFLQEFVDVGAHSLEFGAQTRVERG